MGLRFNEKTVGALIVVSALVCLANFTTAELFPGAQSQHLPPSTNERVRCKVLTVYDGDTLGCDLTGDGQITRPHEEIRLLGIDTPEMHYSKKNRTYGSAQPTDEPFAKEASGWLVRHALRKTVFLEFDHRKADRYGRKLAFVYLTRDAQTSLNAELLRLGYARLLFLGKNRLYEREFKAIEQEARLYRRGLWGR